MQPVPPRRLAHGHGIEPGRLDQYVGRAGCNHGVPAAHHPGKPQGLDVVGHDKVFRIERTFYAIQRLELLAFFGAPHHDAALDLVQVEDMRGLAHRQPGKVGGIHGVRDAFLFEQAEVGGDFRAREPVARIADGDAAQHPRGEAPAGVFGLDAHREGLAGRAGLWQFKRKRLQSQPIDRRRLARHAVVVHRVNAVGGDVHLVERAVARAQIVDAFNGYAAQRQVFGELGVVDGQFRQIGAEPFGQYVHFFLSLSASQPRTARQQVSRSARCRFQHANQAIDQLSHFRR